MKPVMYAKKLWTACRDQGEAGQTLVEYGMIVTLLAMAAVLILTVVGQDVVGLFTGLSTDLQDAAAP